LPNLRSFATYCVGLEPRPLPSTGVARLPRYCGPIRHPAAPGLSVTGIRLVVADHAAGLPVLRALSLCTCCRHYPGTATGSPTLLTSPAVSAFPERVVRSAYASSVSRLARRLLALRPAHSHCHQFVARLPPRLQPVRHLPDCSDGLYGSLLREPMVFSVSFYSREGAGVEGHPIESALPEERQPPEALPPPTPPSVDEESSGSGPPI